jgi:acetyltransferase-like isoleucine patch superfamily enzyme
LHRLRGVKIGKDVFIGDDVYLENEHPTAVEIQSGVQISVRAVILAHTRGPGRVVIEKDVFIGPNTVIAASGRRILRIGEGAVIGAGVVVTQDIPPRVFVANDTAKPIANVRVPLTKAQTMEDFVRGLAPIKRPLKGAARSAGDSSQPTSLPPGAD